MKKIFFILILSAMVVLTTEVSYALLPYIITQITDNDYDDKYPEINDNGHMAWVREGNKIVYYDGSTTTQIGDNYPWDEGKRMDMNNSGHVVWDGIGDNSLEIYHYDGSTTTQLTDNSESDLSPRINNNGDIVWVRESNGLPFYLYLYDGSTTTGVGYQGFHPDINDDGDIVYVELVGGSDYVMTIYDGSTTTPLPTTLSWDSWPSINNDGDAAWMAWDGDYETYLYDGSITRLTTNSYWDAYPEINNNGLIVWGGSATASEIFIYDGAITQLTSNSFPDGSPDINNKGDIVWCGYDGNDWEIYYGTPIPEPSSLLLIGFGLLGGGLFKRKKV